MFTSILATALLGTALSFQTASGMVALEPANDVVVLGGSESGGCAGHRQSLEGQ